MADFAGNQRFTEAYCESELVEKELGDAASAQCCHHLTERRRIRRHGDCADVASRRPEECHPDGIEPFRKVASTVPGRPSLTFLAFKQQNQSS